jgi:hypothetical protein
MRVVKHQLTPGAVLFCACTLAAYAWEEPILFTNKMAITKGREVFEATLRADSQSKSNTQALIGSEVVFVGHKRSPDTNRFVLNLQSNVLLVVEFNPPYRLPSQLLNYAIIQRDTRGVTGALRWEWDWWYWTTAEVLGTLKFVDLEKQVVVITAKQENVKFRDAGF